MATSEGEVSKGKAAFAYLLRKEIAERMPDVVGDFLSEMVTNRVAGGVSAHGNGNGATVSATVSVEPPLEIASPPPAARMIEAAPKSAPVGGGGRKPSSRKGRPVSEATKAKIAATRAANRARRGL